MLTQEQSIVQQAYFEGFQNGRKFAMRPTEQANNPYDSYSQDQAYTAYKNGFELGFNQTAPLIKIVAA